MAKLHGFQVPEGECGNDVDGFKPVLFDVGSDYEKLKTTILKCQQLFKDNAVVLTNMGTEGRSYYPKSEEFKMREVLSELEKRTRGWAKMEPRSKSWEYNSPHTYYGWEADNVILLTTYDYNMEMITRARQRLLVIVVQSIGNNFYKASKEGFIAYFYKAAKQGLIEVFDFSSINSGNNTDPYFQDTLSNLDMEQGLKISKKKTRGLWCWFT